MKNVLLILGAALLIIAVLLALAFRDNGLDRAVEPTPQITEAQPKAGFEGIIRLLEADLQKVYVPLDAPRNPPENAFRIKQRLQGQTARHQEYEVLDHVCDLLIFADQDRAVRKQTAFADQGRVLTTTLANEESAQLKATRQAIRNQAVADWEVYRQKSEAEVKRLLFSLQGKKL
jgi:hypothetical protein